MDQPDTYTLVQQLAAGFESLQTEYRNLFGQHQALEKKLAGACEQYNELAKRFGPKDVATPPLSLISAPAQKPNQIASTRTAAEILGQRPEASPGAADAVRAAEHASQQLTGDLARQNLNSVKIWAGFSADRPEVGSSMMPSISESPLERDFTVGGKPSGLECPFASMANKKLSSHAASVLSRYSPSGEPGSRVNGRESLSRWSGRRASVFDPIKADSCGLSDHQEREPPRSEPVLEEHPKNRQTTEPGICPIRLLDQHSPEEVATYFERHKHQLPRSHEMCVKRYQSNEKQIRELDAKYGSLVSMIQGLGAKHKDLLPSHPDDTDDAEDVDKVRRWARSVSVAAMRGRCDDGTEDDESRFVRPLRDVRLGESPSRPWGIPVPATYHELNSSDPSTRPAQIPTAPHNAPRAPATCPLGTDKTVREDDSGKCSQRHSDEHERSAVNSAAGAVHEDGTTPSVTPRMVFTGPVFLGYSAEDAARILQLSGQGHS